jgi:hypothetical protein
MRTDRGTTHKRKSENLVAGLTRENIKWLQGPADENQIKRLRKQVEAAEKKQAMLEAEEKARDEAAAREQLQVEEARAADAKRQERLDKEAYELRQKLFEHNMEIAKKTVVSTIKHGPLFRPNGTWQAVVDNNESRVELLNYLESLRPVIDVAQECEQLAYGWIQESETGDASQTVFALCYEGYECGWGGAQYVGINALGEKMFEDNTSNWVELSKEHDKLGYINLHSS